MTQNLVITAVGADRPGVCNHVVQLVTKSGRNIIDSQIALFGNEFTLIILLSATNANITRVEIKLSLLGQKLDLITMMKRTSEHAQTDDSYHVEVFIESENQVGITEKFTQFFADGSLSAQTIQEDKTLSAKKQFHTAMTAKADAHINFIQLNEGFDDLCINLKVQGSLNFIKNSQ